MSDKMLVSIPESIISLIYDNNYKFISLIYISIDYLAVLVAYYT